jgi:hypothetical protein
LSLDGLAPVHDEIRRSPGLFDRCVRAIHTVHELKPDMEVGLSTLICEPSLRGLPGFVTWVFDNLPVHYVNFQAYNQVTAIDDEPNWWRKSPLWPKDDAAVAEVMDALAQMRREGVKIANPPGQFARYREYFAAPDRQQEGTISSSCSRIVRATLMKGSRRERLPIIVDFFEMGHVVQTSRPVVAALQQMAIRPRRLGGRSWP